LQSPTEMAAVFERIRAAVFQEATRPDPYNAERHVANQKAFTAQLVKLCKNASLRPDMPVDELWQQVWEKTRYAGFKAEYVTKEIERLRPFFRDFRVLAAPEWSLDPESVTVKEFLGKTGRFAGVGHNKNAAKFRKILRAAATFRGFPPGVPALVALFGEGYDKPDALWSAHDRLEELVGFTTALHVMLDLGFNCVKPDIWLVRLMCRLGWLGETLPAGSGDAVIRKKYQSKPVAVAVIGCAREIARAMNPWHPDAPLREFDFVLVKYGQTKGEFGIERSLDAIWPVERIMEWNPSDSFPAAAN
jgi:hypothetical protein